MSKILPRVAAPLLVIVCCAALCAAESAPAPNTWTPLGDGTYPPPKGSWPALTGPGFLWLADRDCGVVAPILTETEGREGPGLRKISFESPKWEFVQGKTPSAPDLFDSPRGYVYLPGLKKILFLKQEWYWSSKRQPTAGWLVDPETAAWEPLLSPLNMSEVFEDYNPAASHAGINVPVGESVNKDGKRLPVWGALCYDPLNKEAVSFGGAGTWGRVSKTPETVAPGDWFYDEPAKRVRRLLPGEKPVTARRWFPSNCGTWLFSEADKQWKPVEQPLGQQPPTRILPGMAFDAGEKKIVMFGGDDLQKCYNDTWVYDCAKRSWSQVKTPVAPCARAGHALIYVPDQKVVLLAGGYAGGWAPLNDVWVFQTAAGTWTKLGLTLPTPAGHASGAYDPKRGLVVMAAFPQTRNNKSMPVLTLKLDLATAPKAAPDAPAEARAAYHCAGKNWGGRMPSECLTGDLAPGDPKAGLAAVAAQPANTWVLRKPPYVPPGRDWGSNVYDVRTHRAYAWGGGHSHYPGADVIEYGVDIDRWVGMADAANYNPVWLHGMVSGPPGISPGGWSLLPTHSRKSYGIDPTANALITYMGDVYDLKHRMFMTNIGITPGNFGVSSQISFVSTPHGLYAYSTDMLIKANVPAGKWDVFAKGGPKHDEHGHLCHDSKRNRLVYFTRDTLKVWVFDFATKQWSEDPVAGKAPAKACGDSTYIPELDAALLVLAEAKDGPEKLYFYKLAEHKWYSAPSEGDKFQFPNHEGRDYSPIYDPELKAVVRIKNRNRMEVAILRLDPATLKLTPLE
ncbi:MAG: hypothetical protein KIS92_10720 [Planctomycetota bacterium]|nr:hypothetical protein [Planctomycetota bacterium]